MLCQRTFSSVFRTVFFTHLNCTVYLRVYGALKEQIRRGEGVQVQLQNCLTSALDGGEWLAWRPGRFTTRKISALCPLNWRRSWRFGEEKNIFSLPGFDPRNVQPVAVLTATLVNVIIWRQTLISHSPCHYTLPAHYSSFMIFYQNILRTVFP